MIGIYVFTIAFAYLVRWRSRINIGKVVKIHYFIHPQENTMYRDFKIEVMVEWYKREIANYMATCFTCEKVKAEHQRTAGLLHPLPIPK